MTAADWGVLIPAILAFLTAGTAWFKARMAAASAKSAHIRLNAMENQARNRIAAPDRIQGTLPDGQ